MILFWILAPIMVLAALGMVLSRKAVHAALLLAVVMICLAIMYAALDAPFLFAVQIIVYTGAILMLFLFVLMLVGVDASDSVVETIKGQRLLAAGLGLLFGATVVLGVAQTSIGALTGFDAAAPDGNVVGVARLLFGRYVLAFEVTSALLITAALGAMVLAHRERTSPKVTQRQLSEQRMRAYAEKGAALVPAPTPGVYARHNAVDASALLPDGSPARASVSRALQARGTVRLGSTTAVDRVSEQMTDDDAVVGRPSAGTPTGEYAVPPTSQSVATSGDGGNA